MSVDAVHESLYSFFAEEVICSQVGRYVACEMIVAYPDGDSVVVYADVEGERVEITDLGEGYSHAVNRPYLSKERIRNEAEELCADQGVRFRKDVFLLEHHASVRRISLASSPGFVTIKPDNTQTTRPYIYRRVRGRSR